jgi:hypothetical protein
VPRRHPRAATAALAAATATVTLSATLLTGIASAAAAETPQQQGTPVHAVLTLKHAGDAATVTSWARHHGLTVTHRDGSTLVVQGSPSTAGKAFGTHISRWAKPQRAAVPGALKDAVTSVAGFDSVPMFHPMAIPGGYTGADIDSAYAVAPSSTAGKGLTIATIQFSGWNSSDATTYAQAAGINLAPGQIQSISVNGASTTTPDNGGDLEVALDVEALLAVAPAAKQRVYVTTNDYAGSLAVYKQIAADAANGLVQVVSMSWGMCEADTNAYTLNNLDAPIQQILGAGATMFASSGDNGPYGCSYPGHQDTTLSTVFPASDPNVVGVGGTTLDQTSSGWSETGWSGSGGGASTIFNRPTYQSAIGQSGSARMVPDVSALADANTGLTVYIGSAGGWVRGGGTSLATPLWAGTLAASMSAVGRTTGMGDIHGKLYSAASTFRDVTSGSTGPYTAGSGYDMVTGLGSPQWSKLAPALGIAASATSTGGSTGGSTGTSGTTSGSSTQPTSGGTQTTRTTDPSPTTSPAPTQPATAPRTTADACPSGMVPSSPFTDVLANDVHLSDINCTAWWGLAHGTTSSTFTPGGTLTRGQMAGFIARLVTTAGGQLPTNPRDAFPDDEGSVFAQQIDQLAMLGIVRGTADGLYHPEATVTRAQMASFVNRAYNYVNGAPLGPAAAGFPDVATGSAQAADIDDVAGAGIAVGYADGTFRPSQPVTREEVASFLARLLDLMVTQGYATPPSS